MAGVIGSGSGGYATIDPLAQNAIGAAMANTDDLALKNRALMEDRLAKQAAERLARQKMAQEKMKEDKAELDKTKVDYTQYKSYNGPLFDATLSLKNKYNEASQALANNFSISNEEANKHRDTMAHSLEMLNRLGQTSKMVNDNAKHFADHAGDYDADSYAEYMHRMKAINDGQFKIDMENGSNNITTLGQDGKEVTMSFEDYVNGNNPNRKVDLDKIMNDTASSIKLPETGKAGGGFQTNMEQWNKQNVDSLKLSIKGLLEDRDKRYALEKKYGTKDEAKLSQLAFDEIFGKVKTKNVTTGNDLAEREYRDKKANKKAKEDELKPIPTTLSKTVLLDDSHMVTTKDANGKVIKKTARERDKKGIYEHGLTFTKGLDLTNVGGEKGLNNLKIKSVFANDKDEIIITADVPISKATTTTTDYDEESTRTVEAPKYSKTTIIASPETQAAIAKAAGLSSQEELLPYILKMNKVKAPRKKYDEVRNSGSKNTVVGKTDNNL